MKKEEIRKYQLFQLEILKYTHEICSQNGIKYYLAFGTLLGAIRGKGFIPWDADIDIAMFRDDYDKFCEYCKNNIDSRLFLEHYTTEKNHASPHAVLKLKGTHVIFSSGYSVNDKPQYNGIYIDIFPIDEIPADEKIQKSLVKQITRLQRIVTLKQAPCYGKNTSTIKKAAKKFIAFMLKPVSYEALNKKMDSVFRRYKGINSGIVAILTDPRVFAGQKFKAEIFGEGRICEFEGMYFSVPTLAEEFLKIRYGDYLKLPPENERFTYFDNTIDYIDYGMYNGKIGL